MKLYLFYTLDIVILMSLPLIVLILLFIFLVLDCFYLCKVRIILFFSIVS